MCTKILRNSGVTSLLAQFLRTESTSSSSSLSKNQAPIHCHIWNRHFSRRSQQSLLQLYKPRSLLSIRSAHDWKRQMDVNEQRRKIIPKLVYLHNPWKYLVTKFNLWRLKWFWDYEFNETDFIEGSKQAAIVMTDIIRRQMPDRISEFTTPVGFQQITRDMLLSRNDTRLKLVRFDKEHLRRAIPMKVATRQNFGRKYAFIDMLFVGLRNTKDFDSAAEAVEINEIIRRMDDELKTPSAVIGVPHRIVFAEIFIRFRRDYTESGRQAVNNAQNQANSELSHLAYSQNNDSQSWAVSFYKILTFDVLNYDPNPHRAPLK